MSWPLLSVTLPGCSREPAGALDCWVELSLFVKHPVFLWPGSHEGLFTAPKPLKGIPLDPAAESLFQSQFFEVSPYSLKLLVALQSLTIRQVY